MLEQRDVGRKPCHLSTESASGDDQCYTTRAAKGVKLSKQPIAVRLPQTKTRIEQNLRSARAPCRDLVWCYIESPLGRFQSPWLAFWGLGVSGLPNALGAAEKVRRALQLLSQAGDGFHSSSPQSITSSCLISLAGS
jgi:hypothetical protein